MKTIIALSALCVLMLAPTRASAESLYSDAPVYNAHSSFTLPTWQYVLSKPTHHEWSPFTALEIIFGAKGGSASD